MNLKRERSKSLPAAPVRTLLDAELPAASGAPLLRIQLQLETRERGGGEESHLRLHLQSSLGNAALAADTSPAPPRPPQPAALPRRVDTSRLTSRFGAFAARLPARGAAALLQRGLGNSLVRRAVTPLLQHDLNTWVDVRASTAPLMRGVAALMPSYTDKLRQIGVQLPSGDGPLAHSWAGATDGPNPGFAQFSILRFDQRHLPTAAAALLGGKAFQLVATIAQVIEERAERSV